MGSGYNTFAPGTRVRIKPEYREHPQVGTVAPGLRSRASGVVVIWDEGWIGTHDQAELVPDDYVADD